MAELFQDPDIMVASAIRNVKQKRQERLKTERVATEVISKSADELQNILSGISAKSAGAFNTAEDALTRLEAIESNPNIVNNIMQLFDSDFDAGVQKQKLQRAQFELSRASQQTETAKDLHENRVKQVARITGLAALETSMAADEVNDLKDAVSLINTTEDITDKRINRTVSSLTEQQILSGQIPDSLKSNPGLVQAQLMKLQADRLGLSLKSVQLQNQQFELVEKTRQRSLASMSDDELQSLSTEQARKLRLSSQDIENQLLLNTSTRLDFLKLQNDIKKQEQDITSGEIGIGKNKLELRQNLVKDFLGRRSSGQLLAMKEKAAAEGSLQIMPGVSLTSEEIERALVEQQGTEAGRIEAATSSTLINMRIGQAKEQLGHIALTENPGTDIQGQFSATSLPQNLRNSVELLTSELQIAQQLEADNPNVKLTNRKNAIVAQLEEKINQGKKEIQERFASLSDGAGKAAEEYLEKGRIDSPGTAAELLATNPGEGLLAHSPVLSQPYEDFRTAFVQIAQESGVKSINFDTMSFAEIDPETFQVMVSNAITKSGVRGKVVNRVMQSELLEAMLKLHEDTKDKNGSSPFSEFVNPQTRRLSPMFFDQNEEGRFFSESRFNLALGAVSKRLQNENVLRPDEILQDFVFETMRNNSSSIRQRYFDGDSIYASAFGTVMGGPGNNINGVYLKKLAAFESLASSSVEESVRISTEKRNISQGGLIGLLSSSKDPKVKEAIEQNLAERNSNDPLVQVITENVTPQKDAPLTSEEIAKANAMGVTDKQIEDAKVKKFTNDQIRTFLFGKPFKETFGIK